MKKKSSKKSKSVAKVPALLPDLVKAPMEAPPLESLFKAWVRLNGIIASDRSRFDVLREKLDLCHSEDEARQLIRDEEFGDRYPLMPENWKYPKSSVLILGEDAPVRLDFGCGQNPKEGFEGVDLLAPNPKHRIDLWKFPLPWEDSSVDEIFSSHFLEHLPMREVEERDLYPGISEELREEFLGKDFLFAFMDECWRILKPDATMTVHVPNARSDRAFQDPTHRRFFVEWTFAYFTSDWRAANKLDHYRVKCHFGIHVNPIVPVELTTLHAEAQAKRFRENWNTVLDWVAVMKAAK